MKHSELATQSDISSDHQDPEYLLKDLCATLETYLDEQQIADVRKAHLFGAQAHLGQQRLSGEPYINHPLSVAKILADLHMNTETVIAAILHDVIEDTPTAKDQLVEYFGVEVAKLVDGVSKLDQIEFETQVKAQAENFRKMLLAMVEDIRVIIIKLADRLHNMRTLGVLPLGKRNRIAKETLEIYAPIANRLGMNEIRIELQELGFREAYPMRYRALADAVKKSRGNRKEIISKIKNIIRERFKQENIECRLIGREKHLYSIYQKMRNKRLSFSEVFDVYAFRIIVENVDSCYRVLGVVHNIYKPVPGKFKDYIAIPKANGYQALHTVLFGPYGVHIEVQIRSEDMEKVAEAGVAAHWLYKLGEKDKENNSTQNRAREWMRGLLEIQKNAGDSLEFLENVKIDLFPDEIYVFTPKGKIMALPRGASAVDFAYAVHTDVGNSCIAVKIDRRLSPLSSTLFNGQTVEVITSVGAKPNPSWLNFVISGKARSNIRSNLKNLKRHEAINLGKRMMDQVFLKNYTMSMDDLTDGQVEILLREFNTKTIENLYEEVGLGKRLGPLVARRLEEVLIDNEEGPLRSNHAIKDALSRYMPAWLGGGRNLKKPVVIKGADGLVTNFAKCCRPIPGDPIQGFVSSERGIVIHTESCKNVKEYKNHPEKWIEVQWEADVEGEFLVDIRVEVVNRRGVLAMVAAAISDMGINISNVSIDGNEGKYSIIDFTISAKNRKHLAKVMRSVKALDNIVKINRKRS